MKKKISKFTRYLLISADRIAKLDNTPITKEEIDNFKLSNYLSKEEIETLEYCLKNDE